MIKNIAGKVAKLSSHKKYLAVFVFLVAFAGIGSFKMYSSSAAAASKNTSTVVGCRNTAVVLNTGSSGACVRTLQSMLNFTSYLMPNTPWGGLDVDGQYGPATKGATKAYQQYFNGWASSIHRPDLRIGVDGVAGQQTFGAMHHTCINIWQESGYGQVPAPCAESV